MTQGALLETEPYSCVLVQTVVAGPTVVNVERGETHFLFEVAAVL